MADGKDFSEWMGVILDVFNDRPVPKQGSVG